MKKITALLLCVVMLAIPFTACNSSGNKTEQTEGETTLKDNNTTDANTSARDDNTTEEITTAEDIVTTTDEASTEEVTPTDAETSTETTPEEISTEEQTTEEQTTEAETTESTVNDGPVNIGTYDQFDLDTYMSPIWSGRVVHNETVMFIGMDDSVKLLYPADEIISVRSYDLKTEYVKGVDYDYQGGYIYPLEGTKMPVISLEKYYNGQAFAGITLQTKYNGKPTNTYWGEGTAMTMYQVAVTYKHSSFWQGYDVECSADKYEGVINKLKNGEDVTIMFYGDSITNGASASEQTGLSPRMPTYPRLITMYLAEKYGYTVHYVQTGLSGAFTPPAKDDVFGTNGTITYVNPSVGGWTCQLGINNYDTYVRPFIDKYGCDLFLLAYGMNDNPNGTKTENRLCKTIIDKVVEQNSDVNVMLVATMVPNPNAIGWYGTQATFEKGFKQLADSYTEKGVPTAVACMTSMSLSVLETKRFNDYTGNNINHPNDFMARIYAQVIIETLVGYENLPE